MGFKFERVIDSDDEEEKFKKRPGYKDKSKGQSMEDIMARLMMVQNKSFAQLKGGYIEEESKDLTDKRNEMKAKFGSDKPYLEKSYIVEFKLTKITPKIYRRLQIPGNMTLHSLHDKVLVPAMGWCRNYHSYYFQQLPEGRKQLDLIGAVFGPVESQAIDSMHMGVHGIELLDDREYKVGQFLQKKGDKLRYLYDYGDQFEHKLTVEEVIDPVGDQVGAVEVLGGANACPPEDGHGNNGYLETLDDLSRGMNTQKGKEANYTIINSSNYRGTITTFDPTEFSLKLAKRRVMQALQSKTSAGDSSNMMNFNCLTGTVNQPSFKGTRSISQKPSDNCAICGQKSTQKCGKCKIVYYCGRDHQVEHWSSHKKVCSKERTLESEPSKGFLPQ